MTLKLGFTHATMFLFQYSIVSRFKLGIIQTVLAMDGSVRGKAVALLMNATPPPPNYVMCNRVLGEDVNIAECLAAKQQMPLWLSPKSYNYIASPRNPWTLPADYTAGQVPWVTSICSS